MRLNITNQWAKVATTKTDTKAIQNLSSNDIMVTYKKTDVLPTGSGFQIEPKDFFIVPAGRFAYAKSIQKIGIIEVEEDE